MADWEALSLFANPLIKMRVDDVQSIAEVFYSEVKPNELDLQREIEQGEQNGLLGHYGNYTTLFSDYPNLKRLQATIEEYGTFAYQELLNYRKSGEMRLLSAWFNLAQPGASQAKHAHANSLLSGTLYLNTDEDTSITFYHPLINSSLHNELFDQAVQSTNSHGLHFHYTQIEVSVTAGDCLFWPSYLHHGYMDNRTKDRLSMSFNLMPSRLNSVYQITQ